MMSSSVPTIAEPLERDGAATTPAIAVSTANGSSAAALREPAGAAATSTEDRTTEPSLRDDELWHICAAHAYVGDGDCRPGCKSFCGKTMTCRGETNVPEDETSPGDWCVVCSDLCPPLESPR